MFPKELLWNPSEAINDSVNWMVQEFGTQFESFSDIILQVLLLVEGAFRQTPYWVILLGVAGLSYASTRHIRLSAFLTALAFAIGILGLWDKAMQTLALMLVATTIAVLLALPLGILISKFPRIRGLFSIILDAMQTLPSFVYLIPAIMLFGLGKVPAVLATVIYALPPLVRLTDLGIRLVDRRLVEAGQVFGANRWHQLKDIELPLARPNIMQGINQTTMMALSMVVIASMIGARGLGEQVLLGIQRLDVGQGLTAGLAIVAMAVILDRITQGWGRKETLPAGK